MFEAVEMLLGSALGGAGLFLLIDGLRGQRIGREPRCRKCEYSLMGRVEGHDQCPECGSWLDLTGAVCYGDRQRRPRRAMLGILMLLLAAGWLVIRLAASLGAFDVMNYKPTWWVFNEMKSGTPGVSKELCNRLVARKLSQAQIDRIADWVLAKQADRQGPWADEWSDVIETAHRCKLIDKERWERYIRQGYAVQVRIRPVVRPGDTLPVEWRVGPLRLSTAMPSLRTFVLKAKGGELLEKEQTLTSLIPGFGTSHEGEPEVGLATTSATAPLGRHKVVLKWDVTAGGLGSVLTKLADAQELDCEVTDKPSAVGVNRPELRQAIVDCLSAEIRGGRKITFIANNPPMDLAFDVFQVFPVQRVVFRKGMWTRTTIDLGDYLEPGAAVRLMLCTSPVVAAETIDIREYWDGELVELEAPNRDGKLIGN